MNYWLVKTEPETYSWDDLVRDVHATWDGVRNHTAKINLQKMQSGDKVFIYYSGKQREIVGLATVTQTAFNDPSDDTGTWFAVKLKAENPLNQAISLDEIKKHPVLKNMVLTKNTRLSVQPVTKKEFDIIIKLSNSK